MFLLTLRKFSDLRVFRREAAEAYTNGNQSFLFLDMALWALLEQTEKTDFWKMQQNYHNYSSQVSRLHRSSLLPIVLLLHSAFLSAIVFSDPLASKIKGTNRSAFRTADMH